ncbi:hypothetical protein AVEN_225577-1 [Araneus ventricosus]|uniref:Uncharacterized protein n=1 Tax=Araneus ventricosus TaxID=182803 RepID=A0A4Y2MM14_ARAVE|nr:hypothetical protein AVEN_225577-1 [Araneus ventricosus]
MAFSSAEGVTFLLSRVIGSMDLNYRPKGLGGTATFTSQHIRNLINTGRRGMLKKMRIRSRIVILFYGRNDARCTHAHRCAPRNLGIYYVLKDEKERNDKTTQKDAEWLYTVTFIMCL